MSNSAWLADLLKMKDKAMSGAEILAALREGHKRGDYPNLCAKWARANIRFYGMGERDEG